MSATPGSVRRALHVAVPPTVVIVALLAAWQGLHAWLKPSQFLVPSPWAVVVAAREHWPLLWGGLLMTGGSAVLGFAISAALGIAVGSALSASRFLMRGFFPLATLLQMVPLVAIAPLLLMWCGPGPRTAVASAVIVSVFPVLAATLDGLRGTDRRLVELFDTLGATPAQRWRKLHLPAALPSIATGLRIAAGLAVIGTVVGEFVGAYAGEISPLGITILSANREGSPDLVFAAVALAALVGFALFAAVSLGGWLALRRWHDSTR
ncbi:MAG: ABC transporter permease [Phycisphaerae bacterium]|nr:ABC transporter permease [Phycisphaerae bacterium]